MATELTYGIPDLVLPRVGGGSVHPGWFVGHPLVVLFCPANPAAAAAELEQFAVRADEFDERDAWLVTVCDKNAIPPTEHQCKAARVHDPDGLAWDAFSKLSSKKLQREVGAAFLFGRGGALQHVWEGSGHAGQVVDELSRRMSQSEPPPMSKED